MTGSEALIYESVFVEARRSNGVCAVRFGATDHAVLWTSELEEHFFAAVDACEHDDKSSVISIMSRGQDFCRGADIAGLRSRLDNLESESVERVLARRVTRMIKIPKLVVAGIHGPCVGIGLAIALTCDVRIATPGASFISGFGQRGLVAEHGSAWLLPRIVGHSRAAEMLLTSQPVSGETALDIGLVNHLAEDLESKVERICSVAAKSVAPQSIAAMKQQLHRGMSSTFDDAVVDAAHAQVKSMGTQDAREGIDSFLDKRPPQFWDRFESRREI